MKWRAYPEYKDSGVEWLGKIPEHWGARRLKYVASLNDETLGETTDPDFEMLYVDISSVDAIAGIQHKESLRFQDAPSRARRRVRHGDVVVSTVRTYLRAIAPIVEPEENLIVSTGFAIIRPMKELESQFAFYALRAPYFVEAVVANSVGVSYPAINSSELATLFLGLPPEDEQRAIAAFLDRETERIDALIARKERQIELLQEKRAALISHAVTKGLDPNAPMKDSGVEWLGEIPAHWEVKKVKFLTRILRGKFTHRPRNDPRMYDGSYPFIQTGDVVAANKYIREYHQTLSDDGFQVSKQFPKGTLVMTIAANIGDMAILDLDACFPDSIVGLVPGNDVRLDYLYYMFIGMRQSLFNAATINTQLNLNVERIGSLVTVQPPLKEQLRIVEYLDKESEGIDNLISKVGGSMNSLREYRTALISAAVTGKIDVREEQVQRTS